MAKSRKPKPSFDAPADAAPAAAPAWVYRSDAAPEPKTASVKPRASSARAAATPPPVSDAPPISRPASAADVPMTSLVVTPTTDRAKGAAALVERYAAYSAAAGLVPVPAVDAAAIAGVQVTMLRALSAYYGVPFSQELGKSLVAALLGGLMPSLAGYQLLKFAGPLAGVLGISGFAATSTWAVGQVFVAHFESGGTLLDVNVEQSRRQVAARLSRA